MPEVASIRIRYVGWKILAPHQHSDFCKPNGHLELPLFPYVRPPQETIMCLMNLDPCDVSTPPSRHVDVEEALHQLVHLEDGWMHHTRPQKGHSTTSNRVVLYSCQSDLPCATGPNHFIRVKRYTPKPHTVGTVFNQACENTLKKQQAT